MKRLKLGDLFELETSEGYAYVHFIYKDNKLGELIRILPQLYNARPSNLGEIVSHQERFMVFFPLSIARKRKIVNYVGNYNIEGYNKPKYMRTEYTVKGEFLGWHIIDTETWQRRLVKSLTSEEKKLSPWGIWNDTLLIERINQNWNIDDWS